jgi:hypothetical protein
VFCNQVHFRPDEIGTWTYKASYVKGANVAMDDTNAISASYFDGASGTFDIANTYKVAPDLRAKGMLRYVGEHHLQFDNGEFFLKAGADSPENLLAYVDFGTLRPDADNLSQIIRQITVDGGKTGLLILTTIKRAIQLGRAARDVVSSELLTIWLPRE